MSRPRAILKLPKNRASLLVTRARAIVLTMTDNPWFPSPDPPLATVEAAIEALAAAEAATLSRTVGNVEVRDGKRKDLAMLLEYLRAYVQKIANADTDNAAQIIESAGIYVKRPRTQPANVFSAKAGRLSGTVKLVAPQAGNRVAYEWAYSTDGKKTWIALPVTVKANTLVRGLLPGAMVYFRYRTSTKDGVGDWSQPVALTVG